MTEREVRKLIKAWAGRRSLDELAAELGLSKGRICQLKGDYRRPCGKILDVLGIQRRRRGHPGKNANRGYVRL